MVELSKVCQPVRLLFRWPKITFQTDKVVFVTFGVKGGFESREKVVDETKFSYWGQYRGY